MIPKVQAVKRDSASFTITVAYSDDTTETYMDGYDRLPEITVGLAKSQVHRIVDLSKTAIKISTTSGTADNGRKLGRTVKADDKVACMDMPEARPDRNPNEQAKVYYHDRYPSMPIRSIVGDAIGMLNRNKKLRISEFDLRTDGIDGGEVSLVLAANRVTEPWLRKVLEVTFPQRAFERFGHDVDRCAGLKAKLDTNTYIKLRIAFLLYQAIKLNDRDAERINLDIFRVFASDTGPDFTL